MLNDTVKGIFEQWLRHSNGSKNFKNFDEESSVERYSNYYDPASNEYPLEISKTGGEMFGTKLSSSCSIDGIPAIIIELSKEFCNNTLFMALFNIGEATKAIIFPKDCSPQKIICQLNNTLSSTSCNNTVLITTYDGQLSFLKRIKEEAIHYFCPIDTSLPSISFNNINTTSFEQVNDVLGHASNLYAPIKGAGSFRCFIDGRFSPLYHLPQICGESLMALAKGLKLYVFNGFDGCAPWDGIKCEQVFDKYNICDNVVALKKKLYEENLLTDTISIQSDGVDMLANIFCAKGEFHPPIATTANTTTMATIVHNIASSAMNATTAAIGDIFNTATASYSNENDSNENDSNENFAGGALDNFWGRNSIHNRGEDFADQKGSFPYFMATMTTGGVLIFAAVFVGLYWFCTRAHQNDEIDGDGYNMPTEQDRYEKEVMDPLNPPNVSDSEKVVLEMGASSQDTTL